MKRIFTLFFALAIAIPSFSQIFIDEDFSTFTDSITPPLTSGWKNIDSISPSVNHKWRFDNPGSRTLNSPIVAPSAIFDSDLYGTVNQDAYLQSTSFDASNATVVILEFDHYYQHLTGSIAEIQIFDGTNWISDTIFSATTANPKHEIIDISQHVAGVSNAQIQFHYIGNYDWYWILDNVTVFQPVPDDAAVVSIDSLPISACNLDSNETISASIVNFGSTVIRNIPIRYSINGGAIVPETITDSILPGDTLRYSFATKANLSAAGSYNILVYSAIRGDNNFSNDSAFFTTSLNPSISTFPYNEGFENGNGGWSTGGTNSTWALGTPAGTVISGAANGVNAYVTNLSGTYNDNEASFVLSPCFDFSLLNAPQVKMNIWYESENSWDGTMLQMTLNGGQTWTQVGSLISVNNWYNDNTINGLQAAGFSGEGWTNSPGSGGWVLAEHDLPSAANQPSVRFRVFHGTDGSVTEEGFAFDDFLVQDAPALDVGVVSVESPVSGCGLGAADTVCITIANFGSTAITNVPVAYEFNNQLFADTAFITLNPGDSATYCFTNTVNVGASGMYTILAYTTAANDGNALNDTTDYDFDNIPLVASLPYFENFEAGNGGWTASGTANSWAWGTPAGAVISSAAGGFGAWVTNLTGNHNNNELSYMESPCIDFSSLTVDPILYFSLTYDTESCCDEGWIDYSTDGGLTWNRLIDNGTALEWFNDIGNQWWDGTSSGGAGVWVNAQNELVGLAGQANVRIRFGFSSDGSVTEEGFGIDNIRIDLPAATDAGVVGLSSPVTGCGLSGSDSVKVLVKNFGSDTLTSTPVSYVLNGGAATTETISSTILPGDTLEYTFTSSVVNVSFPGAYTFKLYTGVGADTNPLNDTLDQTVTSIPIATFPYAEDFEFTNGGWTTGGNASTWAWGTPAGSVITSAAGGTGAWVTNLTGVYNNSEFSYLESPCFDLSGQTSDPTLRFEMTFGTESCCDEGWVEVSTDGGVTWNKSIDLGGAQNWYNDIGNQWWDGNNPSGTGNWDTTSNVLTGVAGFPSVKVRFMFSSDGSVQQEGFGIDNVSLDVATAINEVSDNSFEFSIYPNPTKGQFTLIVPATRENINVEVFDTKGQLIYRELMNAADSRINKVNIDRLSKGLYFVKVSDRESSSIKKLIVQ